MAIIKEANMVEPEVEPEVILNNSSEGMADLIKMIKGHELHEWERLPSSCPASRITRGGESGWKCKNCGDEQYSSYACLPRNGCKKS